jgi:hypothetical protein
MQLKSAKRCVESKPQDFSITNEGSLPPNVAPSPPPMEAPTTSKSKQSPSSLLQRILEGLQSQHQQQPQQPSHTSSRPRSRHSRHRSSRSSETITAMLLIAADRLSQETSRANEAERQSSEILAHFNFSRSLIRQRRNWKSIFRESKMS